MRRLTEDRCVCCGAVIPEGRMVCPPCELGACMHLWGFDHLENGRDGKAIVYRCARCGSERREKPAKRESLWEG